MDRLLAYFSTGPSLWVVTGILILAIVGMQSFALWRSYEETRREGERDATNIVAILSGAIQRDFNLLELSLMGIEEAMGDDRLPDLDPALRNRILFHRETKASDFGAMMVLDAQGNVRFDNAPLDIRSFNFADREYFAVHREGQDIGTYVSRPFISRLANSEMAIGMSRRLLGLDGEFAGVTSVAIRLSYFAGLFRRAVLPPGAIVALVRDDGTIILREPSTDGKGNSGLNAGAAGRAIGTARWADAISPLDGEHRLYFTQRIGTYPLLLTVGLSARSLFAGWYFRAAVTLLVTISVCLVLALTVAALATSLRLSREMEGKLERMAISDPLTGLPNRRALDLTLESEMQRCLRERQQLAVLMVDVDHFKRVNDTYGHRVGDTVLAEIAQRVLHAGQRPGDFVCRYGGEEFVVVLPNTPAAGADTVAERIRAGVAAVPVLTNGASIEITVSVGIAIASERDSSGELIARSDTALYMAKRSGRNRVARLESFVA